MICDLEPGKQYDAAVQAIAGDKIELPSEGPEIVCMVASEISNDLPVSPTAPPHPTRLRIASIHPDGIDVTWPFPQQFGDATVSVSIPPSVGQADRVSI